MAYTRRGPFIDVPREQWDNPPAGATPLDAATVNHMEQGIAAAHALIPETTAVGSAVLSATDAAAARTALGAAATTDRAALGGLASLDNTGLLPASQRPLSPAADAARLLAFGFGNAEMAMRSYTVDGATLTPLPGVRPVAHPSTNPVYGVRDATVVQHGGRFWMAATRPAKNDYLGPATALQIHVSDDLVTWTWAYDLPADVTGTYRAWAPEWFVDDDGSVYLYYSVSTQAVAIGSVTQFDIYARKATDHTLTTWGPSTLMVGISASTTAGAPGEVIDAQVTKLGRRYVMFVKDEVSFVIMRAWADSPLGPWTLDRTGNWLGITGLVEGPQLMRMPGGRFRLFYDRYTANQLAYRDSTDLDTWSAEVTLSYPLADLRHLGLLWLSPAQWQALRGRRRRGTARTTAAQNINTAAGANPTPVTFGVAVGDPDFWASTATTRVVAPETGPYDLSARLEWAANATGSRSLAYRISGGAWVYLDSRVANGGGAGTEQTATDEDVTLTAGQYLELGAMQTSGGTIALNSARLTLKTTR